MGRLKLWRHAPWLLSLVATVVAIVWVGRLELSPDVADLLPDAGEGGALRAYVRSFGRSAVGMVLVRGADPQRVGEATDDAVGVLRKAPRVRAVVDRMRFEVPSDPTLAWAMAGPRARERLRHAVEPAGMRERLEDSRRLLLAPGAAQLAETLRTDPLRLRQLPFEGEVRLAGASQDSPGALDTSPSGIFVADEGRTRLILLSAEGQMLRGAQAKAFTRDVQERLDDLRTRHPAVRFDLTGGHAIAAETEALLRSDLLWSGVLSTLLVGLAFALTFRRLRALVAVLPPLALGTLWTAAAAAIVFGHVSALTLGFVAVVVGVGLDTGVHVYAALLDGRRRGLSPAEAADHARRDTARPALVAAFTAAIAFATLSMSRVPALRQFGLLCAIGEVLTALAILAVTPEVGRWLERSAPPPPRTFAWLSWLDRARRSHAAPILLGIGVFVPVYTLFTLGPPSLGTRLVSIAPTGLPSLETNEVVVDRFGGGEGQWAVLVRDANEQLARVRADRIFEALDAAEDHVATLDGLTRFAPSVETQHARLDARDRLHLPKKSEDLRASLAQVGFEPKAFEAALASFAAPGRDVRDAMADQQDATRLLSARYLASDEHGWSCVYVRPRPGHERQVDELIRAVDPEAAITGFARLDSTLADSVREDLPRVLGAAVALVGAAVLLSLRRRRDGLVALGALMLGALWVAAIVRWWPLPIHLYNAFVLPVLLGITVDEVMFLLHRAREGGVRGALEIEGPNVVVTGVTTACGFVALVSCSFPGLRDMGVLGGVGALVGLVVALGVVAVAGGRYNEGIEASPGGS